MKINKTIYLTIAIFTLAMVFMACSSGKVTWKHQEIAYINTGINPDAWALVPAGEFFEGQFKNLNHLKNIDYDYEIMVTDVTNAQYARYLNEALAAGKIKVEGNRVLGYYPGDKYYGYRHERKIDPGDYLYFALEEPGTRIKFDGKTFTVDRGFENHPVTMVTWFGARAYCQFYGWRLPTELEWEKAARGTKFTAYPWGNEIGPEYANFNLSNKEIRRVLGVKHGITTPVGFFNGKKYGDFQTKDARSPYGLYDMAGNVWQWIADKYPKMSDRFMKGGSWMNYDIYLRIWMRNSALPWYYSINVGFRCVRDVKKPETTEEATEEIQKEEGENLEK